MEKETHRRGHMECSHWPPYYSALESLYINSIATYVLKTKNLSNFLNKFRFSSLIFKFDRCIIWRFLNSWPHRYARILSEKLWFSTFDTTFLKMKPILSNTLYFWYKQSYTGNWRSDDNCKVNWLSGDELAQCFHGNDTVAVIGDSIHKVYYQVCEMTDCLLYTSPSPRD